MGLRANRGGQADAAGFQQRTEPANHTPGVAVPGGSLDVGRRQVPVVCTLKSVSWHESKLSSFGNRTALLTEQAPPFLTHPVHDGAGMRSLGFGPARGHQRGGRKRALGWHPCLDIRMWAPWR